MNNRADRIPRSKVFARFLIEDIRADRHILIGSNLSGFMGYINNAWTSVYGDINLWAQDSSVNTQTPEEILIDLAEKFRIPKNRKQLMARLFAMLKDIDPSIQMSTISDCITNIEKLHCKLNSTGLAPYKDSILKFHKINLIFLKKLHALYKKVKSAKKSDQKQIHLELQKFFKTWFEQKIIRIDDIHATGDHIVNTIVQETPPGFYNRIMMLQNIKGTGLRRKAIFRLSNASSGLPTWLNTNPRDQ